MKKIFFLIILVVFSHSAWSDTQYNLVNLAHSAEAEVKNDIMQVSMRAEHSAKDPKQTAQAVNKMMQQALATVAKHQSVKAKTGQYSTYPSYHKGLIERWQSSQQLYLESTNVEQLSKLVAKLQQQLKIQNMVFVPTQKARQELEDQLLTSAMDKFKQRASLIQKNLAGTSYKIVEISIHTNAHRQHYPVAFRAAAKESHAVDHAAVEQGTSVVNVTINGKIQIQY